MDKTNSVVTVLKKLGYTRRGLPNSLLTMHLCFLGQLHGLQRHSVVTVRKSKLKRATKKHTLKHYFGHPCRVFSEACNELC